MKREAKGVKVRKADKPLTDAETLCITLHVRDSLPIGQSAKQAKLSTQQALQALRSEEGKVLVNRIRKVIKLPPVLSREELLAKLLPIIDNGEEQTRHRIAAMQLYARVAGYMEADKLLLQQNTVNVAANVPFSSVLQALTNKEPAPEHYRNDTGGAQVVDI